MVSLHCHKRAAARPSTQNVGVGYVNPNNRSAWTAAIARLSTTVKTLNISTTYMTPALRQPGAACLMASGWTGSLIWRYLTGAPITATTTDQLLNGDSGERPNQVLSNVYGSGFVTGYLNPAAFAQVPVGTYGNMGVYTIRGPGVPEIDAAVYQDISRSGSASACQARGEAFNLPNNFLRGNPSASITSPTLGSINTAGNPRIMQFSMKAVF